MKTFPMLALTFTLPLLLAACGGNSGTTQPPSNTPYVVSGTLYDFNTSATTQSQLFSGWTGGAGTMQASDGNTSLAFGNVASSGSFSVSLPGTIPNASLSAFDAANLDLGSDNCTGKLSISNTAALTTAVEFGVKGTKNDGAAGAVDANVTQNTNSGRIVVTSSVLVYSNAATNISGKQSCIASGVPVVSNFNINLKAGYNVLNLVVTINANAAGEASGSLNYANGTRASHWIINPGLATPLSLNNNSKALSRVLEQQAKTLFH